MGSASEVDADAQMMDLAEIKVVTDGGPWANHNMPCAVCRDHPAVLNLNCGVMEPCWTCQADGWFTRKKRRWRKPWV